LIAPCCRAEASPSNDEASSAAGSRATWLRTRTIDSQQRLKIRTTAIFPCRGPKGMRCSKLGKSILRSLLTVGLSLFSVAQGQNYEVSARVIPPDLVSN